MKNILAAVTAMILGSENSNALRAPIAPPEYSHSNGRYRSNQRQKRKARRQRWAAGDGRTFK